MELYSTEYMSQALIALAWIHVSFVILPMLVLVTKLELDEWYETHPEGFLAKLHWPTDHRPRHV